jgi:hypothetical protein
MDGRGAGAGAILALNAHSPQDQYVWGEKMSWVKPIPTHTPFALTQRAISISNINGILGQTTNITLQPKDLQDLISNVHLKFSLPNGYTYGEMVGRAILSNVSFLIDGELVESINDDWYVIRDELFLDADQKNSLYQNVGQPNTTSSGGDYIVPLDLFFCHRKGSNNPYLPLCALGKAANIQISLTFYTQDWITNTTDSIDLINPFLIVEGITLSAMEKHYYLTTPLTYEIPIGYREGVLPYNGDRTELHLTPDFKVAMMVWFIRDLRYESTDSRYFEHRYNFGYTTKYIHASVPVTYFDGATNNYINVIDKLTMYFNGIEYLTSFPDGIYHSIQQPMDHGLSVPTRDLYMYCFTENPKNMQIDGAMDFSLLDYKTTRIYVKFLDDYSYQVKDGFSFNLYHYGFMNMTIANGTASFSSD